MSSMHDSGKAGHVLLNLASGLGAAAMAGALGAFAYLGTFTRYLADDYCDTVLVTGGSVWGALLDRYLNISDRYSNLLFTAVTEFLLPRRIEVIPPVMIVLWVVALVWLMREIRRAPGFDWPFPVDAYLGTSLAFFAILEAPSRFQTIYWRSALATHFAPIVYLSLYAALLLFQIRRNEGRRPAIWLGPLLFVAAFFGGGFSEPPDMILLAVAFLALLAVWTWEHGPRRPAALRLLAWTLGGGLLAFLVMKFSPANSFRLHDSPPPDLVTLGYRTLLYSFQFILDSLATLPLPTLVSIGMPFLLLYGLFAARPDLTSGQRRALVMALAVTPVIMYGLIAASFAPSVYGQSYPVERARFAGRLVMTAALMLEGAGLGLLAAQWKTPRRAQVAALALAFLLTSALYPLRIGWNVLGQDLPAYRVWSSDWDVRQAQILAQKDEGQQDIIVPQLPGIEHVKELDTRSKYWVNRCAAEFYGVHSISAPAGGP
jgi:uncharacterized protein DUF6056